MIGFRGNTEPDVADWLNRLGETQETYTDYRLALAGMVKPIAFGAILRFYVAHALRADDAVTAPAELSDSG